MCHLMFQALPFGHLAPPPLFCFSFRILYRVSLKWPYVTLQKENKCLITRWHEFKIILLDLFAGLWFQHFEKSHNRQKWWAFIFIYIFKPDSSMFKELIHVLYFVLGTLIYIRFSIDLCMKPNILRSWFTIVCRWLFHYDIMLQQGCGSDLKIIILKQCLQWIHNKCGIQTHTQ